MTVVSNYVDQSNYDPVTGQQLPEIRTGLVAPNGDASPFKDMPVGSVYVQGNAAVTAYAKTWTKYAKNQRDDDWRQGMGVIVQRFVYTDFTDGGGTSGTLQLTEQIPQGAFVLRATLQNVTGFAGDTSAVITVGGGADADRYNAGTPDVFSDVNAVDLGAPSGTQIHTTANTVTVTITSATDFTSVSAGAATLCIYYLN